MISLYWIKAVAVTAIASICLTYAYVKGGERERAKHAAYVAKQEEAAAAAKAMWDIEIAALKNDVSAAKTEAERVASTAAKSDADAISKIDAAVKDAKSSPFGTEVASQVNAIIGGAAP